MDFIIERLVTLPEELVNLPFYPVDPRVQGWFGLDWAFVLGVTTAYLVGVGILMGIMKTQSSPFSLYAYRIAHNFVMCAVSFYMFAEIMRLGLTQGFFKELDRTTDSLPVRPPPLFYPPFLLPFLLCGWLLFVTGRIVTPSSLSTSTSSLASSHCMNTRLVTLHILSPHPHPLPHPSPHPTPP